MNAHTMYVQRPENQKKNTPDLKSPPCLWWPKSLARLIKAVSGFSANMFATFS